MSDKSRLENNNLTLQNITNTVMNMPDYIEIKNQDKTININGVYNADSGYTGLGTVTVNVSGGGGDVKQFDTVEHMQADSTAQEGDLAVVYREEMQPVTEESEFSSCIFPNEVVLDEAFSGNIYGSFRSTGGGFFDGMIEMSSSSFRFDGYGESDDIRIQYTSSDGITYTRTDGGEELQEFGTTIKWISGGDPFNSIIGNFMKIGGMVFEGLYQYSNNSYSLAPTQFTADNRYVFDKSFYGVCGVDTGTLQNVENLTLDEVRLKAQVFSDLSYLTPSNNVTSMSSMFENCYNLTSLPNFDTSNVVSMGRNVS